jgi:hypothetical protein
LISNIDDSLVPLERITQSILLLLGQRKRFPADFLFELGAEELANLKSHFATSSWGGRQKPPLAFTVHGAIMTATILNSPGASR